MDRIALEGMAFYGYHGVGPEERELGQRFVVDLEMERDLRRAGLSDDPEDTTSYSDVYEVVREVVEGRPRRLLESVAEAIAGRVLEEFEVASVRVTVRKPKAPMPGGIFSHAAVEILRERS